MSILFIVSLAIKTPSAIKTDYSQAQRIAKWKSVYEEILYSFDAVKNNEGDIVPDNVSTPEEYFNFIFPYFNFNKENPEIKNYKYKKMNGKRVKKPYAYSFDKFYETKTGLIISVKNNPEYYINPGKYKYLMLTDINGKEKPNTIGKDIFFVNIGKEGVTPIGHGEKRSKLKANCSPVGSGVYCSQHYLLGGKF